MGIGDLIQSGNLYTNAGVSAILLTKGDTDLSQIVRSMEQVPRIKEICIADGRFANPDQMVWNRHQAISACSHRVIFSQDDDLLHTPEDINRILDAHVPGKIVGCMWQEWSWQAELQGIRDGYEDLVFPGSGSCYDREVPLVAAHKYLQHYPFDDFFRLWCDAAIGVLAPNVQLDIRPEMLEATRRPDRMARLPNGPELKREAMERGRAVRDWRM